MDGFKNTTKTQYSMGGYATGGSAKFGKVMREFKAGTLHSGSKKGPAVTNPKQAFAIAASEARKAPMKKQAGGPVASKTGTRTDPEYGDFVAAGAAKPSAMAVKRAVPVASRTPMASAKKPLSRAMFGDEAAAAMDRAGKAGPQTEADAMRARATLRAAEKREGYNMGGKVMRKAEGGDVEFERTPASISSNITAPSVSFSEAFRENRRAGAKTFMWNGKKYTTELASSAKAASPRPAVAAVAAVRPAAAPARPAAMAPAATAPAVAPKKMFANPELQTELLSARAQANARQRALDTGGYDAAAKRRGQAVLEFINPPKGRIAAAAAAGRASVNKNMKKEFGSEGYNMGGSVMRMAEEDYGYKKGGRAKGSKGPKVMAEKMVATKRTATPTMNAQEMRTMERYQTAMASRPNRQPIVAEGKRTAAALTPILRRAMAAAPPAMNEGALPMTPPAMKKGGKARFQVMRKAEGGAVTLSFTPPSAPPAGQRWIQRDDGQLLLVSTDPNATYVGRSGTVKKVSDLSVYQGGEAGRPAANFVANTAPDVLANLRRVGGLDASYDVPDAGEIGNRQNAKLSFTPPGVAPAGQRYVQRDDGALVLVSTAPNATYTGRSGTVKNVSDLSIYQGGNAYIPAANFAANNAPEVIANLQRVSGLPDTYKAPAAGTLAPPPPRPMPPATRSVPPPGSKTTLPTSSVAGGQMGSVSNPAFQSTGNVDPRNLAETYRASVPGYSYGEDPAGERQFFRYAVAPGAPPPYKTGGAVSVPKTALAARTAQKHTAAMASRPNRKPMVGGDMRKGGTPR